jgi:hypothetical protein
MPVRVDDLLPHLADLIMDMRDEPWTRAVATATIAPKVRAIGLRYETAAGKLHEAAPSRELEDVFVEMWNRYVTARAQPWREAIFVLHPTGKARLNFAYAPMEDTLDA